MSRLRALKGPEPDPSDFCNAFWSEPGGFHSLLGRVKASSRHLEDLRLFFLARSSAEDDYAKKLGRLARAPVLEAGYEVGGVKKAMGEVKKATEQMAHSHAELAGTIRTGMERKLADFIARRDEARKTPQALIEKLFKKRLDLAECLEKARKKYKADAVSVNGLQAQTYLCEGRDHDRVTTKLDKAKLSIQITEKEYRTHLKNSEETTEQWNEQWRAFCDLSQDQEEDRIDFVRTLLWDYANAVSTVCLVDDAECERIRSGLEKCETQRDVKAFVKHSATGPMMTHAPKFVDYANGAQTPAHFGFTKAAFLRSSNRDPALSGVGTSTPLETFHQTLAGRPPSPERPEEVEAAKAQVTTGWQSKVTRKKGGTVAEMVAANALQSRNLQAGGPLSPAASVSSSQARSTSPSKARPRTPPSQHPQSPMIDPSRPFSNATGVPGPAYGHPSPQASLHRSPSLESARSYVSNQSRPGSPRKPLPGIPRLPSVFGRPPGMPLPSTLDPEARQSRGSTPSWVPSVREGYMEG